MWILEQGQTNEVLCFQNIYIELVNVKIQLKLKLNIQDFTSEQINLKQEFGIIWQCHFLNTLSKLNFLMVDIVHFWISNVHLITQKKLKILITPFKNIYKLDSRAGILQLTIKTAEF